MMFGPLEKNMKSNKSWGNYAVDYGYYGEKLIDIIEDAYQFTRDQSSLVIHTSYDKYHRCFSDVFGGVIEYAEFAKEFNKRK